MCGIIGFIDSKKHRGSLGDYFDTLSHRGTDSFGCIVEHATKIYTRKDLKVKAFLKSIDDVPIGDFMLCHNRKTSIGGTTVTLAHPVTIGNTKIIHNGTKKPLYESILNAASDTEAIGMLLNDNHKTTKVNKELLHGAGVVFSLNLEGAGVLVSVDGNRPLFINEDRTVMASEPIFDGSWFLVKPQFKKYDSYTDFIKNSEVYAEKVEIADMEYTSFAYICDACDRVHLHVNTEGLCPACKIEGKTAKKWGGSTYYGAYYPSKIKKTTFLPPKFVKVGEEYEFLLGNVWCRGYLSRVDYGDPKRPYFAYKIVKGVKASTASWFASVRKCKKGSTSVSRKSITPVKGKFYMFSNDGSSWFYRKFVTNTKKSDKPYETTAVNGSEIKYFKMLKKA